MPKGARVLVVDNSPALRSDLTALLRLQGYEVSAAADGRDALTRLTTAQVDIVISDYEMPNMKGDMLRELLRSHPSTLRLPFIMISAVTPPSINDDIAYRALKKPIVISELISNIEKLLMASSAVSRQRAPD
jgi:CheY-like chemotaxis protein